MEYQKKYPGFYELSGFFGKDFFLVQGAGGNSSVKDFENDIILIKASGKQLKNTFSEEIFVPLSLSGSQETLQAGRENFGENILGDSNLRPSIETGFHVLLPHKYVFHFHSVAALSHICTKGSKEHLENLLKGLEFNFVKYVKPGISLTEEIKNALKDKDIDPSRPEIFILENHGVIIAGENTNEIKSLVTYLEKAFFKKPRKASSLNNFDKLLNLAEKFSMAIPEENLEIICSLATDKLSIEGAKKGVLFPDQAVFIGEKPLIAENQNPEKIEDTPPYIIIPEIGVLVSKDAGDKIKEMLLCWAEILLRTNDPDSLKALSKSDIDALLNWDAEKYRQTIK